MMVRKIVLGSWFVNFIKKILYFLCSNWLKSRESKITFGMFFVLVFWKFIGERRIFYIKKRIENKNIVFIERSIYEEEK